MQETLSPRPGPLVIIGGAEDKTGPCAIPREFVRLAGGPRAWIVVLTVASEYPGESGARYARLFEELGAATARVVHGETRAAAEARSAVRAIERASGVFFTGGDQRRIATLFAGTAAERALRRRHYQGAVVAGTSAGAAAMSCLMIAQDLRQFGGPTRPVEEWRGLGLLESAVIDQHFGERRRLGRLLATVARHPDHLGIGIDENTAVVVRGDELAVIGARAVTVVDASGRRPIDVDGGARDDGLAEQHAGTLHLLEAGQRFDLRSRQVVPPADDEPGYRRLASA